MEHPKDCARHHCHARGCGAHVKPEYLMCRRHWFMVPMDLRGRVWATYRDGQCSSLPSNEWQIAAERAINAVAAKEGVRQRHFLLGVDLLHEPPCEVSA